MAANAALQRLQESGWRRGFANVLRKENRDWWGTRTWLVHSIIWLVLINGVVFGVLKSPAPTEVEDMMPAQGTMIFVMMSGLMAGLGIILVMQGAILDEKKSGTAAWVLSKPLSRPAFILAKLVANSVAALLIMIVLQGVVAFVQMQAFDPAPPALAPFLAGLGMLALHLLFYLTLTLMLGTLFKDRAAVMGIAIGLLFGAQFIAGIFPALVRIMPWWIIMPVNENPQALAHLVMSGQPLPTLTPIIGSAVLIVVFVGVALWRFQREEF